MGERSRLAGRQARQAGSTGAGVEEHRWQASRKQSRTALEISAQAKRKRELEHMQKHRNIKNSEFPENAKYRRCVVTVWDVTI